MMTKSLATIRKLARKEGYEIIKFRRGKYMVKTGVDAVGSFYPNMKYLNAMFR